MRRKTGFGAMDYQAVFFDFDGVLADSERLHCRAFQDILKEEGQPFSSEEYFARYIHFDDRSLFCALSADRGLGWDEARASALAAGKARRYLELLQDGDIIYPGVEALIPRLAARVPLGLCSMAAREEIEPLLRRAELWRFFTVVVTAADVRRSKPDPEPYLTCLARLNEARRARGEAALLPRQCLVVEDTRGGVKAGKAAGMTVAAVTHSYTAAELRAAGADQILDGIPALERFLDRGGSLV
jgi:beta-phosphoglucomutase